MKRFRRTAVVVAGAALVVVPATAASAGGGGGHGGSDGDDAVTTVASGLSGPRQLSEYRHDRAVVAESDSGEVSAVDLDTGEVETLVSGLFAPNGVDYEDGYLYIAVGEAQAPPGEEAPVVPEGAATSALLVADRHGTVVHTVDLLEYELDENPDGQEQFDAAGAPYDALSNPFAVLAQEHRVLVADAGANAVLSVDRHTGDVETFFVPPVLDLPGCMNAQPDVTGCDPVPTGIAEGPHGLLYVSTLGAEVPGAGRVYVLDCWGNQVGVIEDLTAPTGIEVGRHGTVYVSHVLEGAPEGEGPPPADFDPTTVGEITRIDRDGSRSTSQVTMPTGLLLHHGALYASAWSVASFVAPPGAPPQGEVVRVGSGTFTAQSG
jgi:sugar lactone lactonase YvrE